MRACLDIPGDAEGGRVVDVATFLRTKTPATRKAALAALAKGQPYRNIHGSWSLTPLARRV